MNKSIEKALQKYKEGEIGIKEMMFIIDGNYNKEITKLLKEIVPLHQLVCFIKRRHSYKLYKDNFHLKCMCCGRKRLYKGRSVEEK